MPIYVAGLGHISLPLPPHPRLVTLLPRVRTGRSSCDYQGPNADHLRSSIKMLVTRWRSRMDKVTHVGVDYCEWVNPYLRQHSHIYIKARYVRFILNTYLPDLSKRCPPPPHPLYTTDYATYVQILTWPIDSPSTLCPFSFHRITLARMNVGWDIGLSTTTP